MAVALLIQTWRAADAEKCLYPRGGLYVHTIKINHFFLEQCVNLASEQYTFYDKVTNKIDGGRLADPSGQFQ
jgi:hypothetical protein